MNRDSTIIQVALFLIVIAILGVAILRQPNPKEAERGDDEQIVPIQEGEAPADDDGSTTNGQQQNSWSTAHTILSGQVVTNSGTQYTERLNSPSASLVKQYFAYIAAKEYDSACDLVAGTKCNGSNPIALETFSKEFEKLTNGYEYVAVKDYGIVAPSGKNVVCVKYSYRYNDDPQGGLISEVMAFYTQTISGLLRITDRVCEKKYKAGRWVRDCPVVAAKEFCEGKIK